MKIQKYDDNLIIKKRNEIYFLSFLEILYIERFGNLTIIHTDEQEIEIRFSLYKLKDLLPNYFLRSHKSYIVNIKKVKQMKIIGNDSTTYEAFFDYEKSALITRDKLTAFIE
ncbi:LytTR family DNA-binding domain-containing protein [Priestia megaterium]|uniref:LytR/AlgR family response regulator transcription factor n=1 Tax=Priestia TaxID=2800373 RepID=UPI001CFB5B85|nr:MULTISPECIES: LytTR family DNA-binding domain-containing protein [Priestia]MED4219516.1 LytTR family DNA-binding domain-containing protein [Priestia megaterium]